MTDDDVELLQQLVMHGGTQAFELVPLALRKVILERQWRQHRDRDGKPFANFEAFIKHKDGLGCSLEDLRAYCRKAPEVDRLIMAEVEPEGSHGTNQHNNGGVRNTKSSDTALYALKRLKRDRPDIFQQVIGGALSVNQAAIEAGFRKKLSPCEQVLKLLPKLTAVDLARVRDACDALQA